MKDDELPCIIPKLTFVFSAVSFKFYVIGTKEMTMCHSFLAF